MGRPIEDAHTCFIPAMFVAGADDEFISPQHCSDIYDQYAGDKSMSMVEGGHNSSRPRHVLDSIAIFLYNTLCLPVGLTQDSLGLRPMGLALGYESSASPRGNAERTRSIIRGQLDG